MPHIQRSILVPFSAEQMFDLVNDVESYPQFLPWCSDAWLDEQHAGRRRAGIEISRNGIQQRLTTENTLDPPQRLQMQLVSGPFRCLEGVWDFEALADDATKVTLTMDFEMAGGVLARIFAPIFEGIINSLVDSFVDRARELYGQRG